MKKRNSNAVVKLKHDPAEGRSSKKAFEIDAEMIDEMRRTVTRVEQMLFLNHKMIERIGELLNISQPPMSGKIEVRWWKSGPIGASPTVTIWDEEKGSPVLIPPARLKLRASRRASFQRNYAETQILLGILEELMEKRAALIKYNGEYKRLVNRFFNSNHKMLAKLHNQHFLDDMEKKIVRNNAEASILK